MYINTLYFFSSYLSLSLSLSLFFLPFHSILMFARSSRLFQRRYLMVAGAVATSAGVVLLQTRKAHAESNQLKFWKSLPGENTPENPGLAKLRGMAAEQRFRTSLAQNNGKTDFDVVIGNYYPSPFFLLLIIN